MVYAKCMPNLLQNNIPIIILVGIAVILNVFSQPPVLYIFGVDIMQLKISGLTQLIFANSYILFNSFFESIFSIIIEPIK